MQLQHYYERENVTGDETKVCLRWRQAESVPGRAGSGRGGGEGAAVCPGPSAQCRHCIDLCVLLPPNEWLFAVLLLWSWVQLCGLRCGLRAEPRELWAVVHSSSPESLAAK